MSESSSSLQDAVAALRKEYSVLLDTNASLDSRLRELYVFKEAHLHSPAGALLLLEAVDTTDSVLLQHEFAYNVGQSGATEACAGLEAIVRNVDKYSLVTRHEAIESLGAIGNVSSIPLLEEFNDPAKEPNAPIRESCELALVRIRTIQQEGDESVKPPPACDFVSVDPSPAFNSTAALAEAAALKADAFNEKNEAELVSALEKVLLDDSGETSLWDRYRAMFSLRNLGSKAAVAALGKSLRSDRSSCLFRHEVAFVLGQLEHPASQDALIEALKDESEAPMVRHEAAEALGAIADPKSLSVLEAYMTHPEGIVRDSCVVAIEMHKYWSQFNGNKSAAEQVETEENKKEEIAATS